MLEDAGHALEDAGLRRVKRQTDDDDDDDDEFEFTNAEEVSFALSGLGTVFGKITEFA